MTCMTTKQKFAVDEPPVVVLANGRYAYRVKCPWEGKNGKELFAYKFCSAEAYKASLERPESPSESERPTAESEHVDEQTQSDPPESP